MCDKLWGVTVENAKRMSLKYPDICCPLTVDVALEKVGIDVPEKYYKKAVRERGILFERLIEVFGMSEKTSCELKLTGRKRRFFESLYNLVCLTDRNGEYLAVYTEPKQVKEACHIKFVVKGESPMSIRVWDFFDLGLGREFCFVDVSIDMDLLFYLAFPFERNGIKKAIAVTFG